MMPTAAARALRDHTTTKGGRYVRSGIVIPHPWQQANPDRRKVPGAGGGAGFNPSAYFPKLVREAVEQWDFYQEYAHADDPRGPAFLTSLPLAWGVYSFKNQPDLSAVELAKTAAGWHDEHLLAGFQALAVEMGERGVERGFIRPAHEANGSWYGDSYQRDPRLVDPGRVRTGFEWRVETIQNGAQPDTFDPIVFDRLADGLLSDGDRAVPWVAAFRRVAAMIHLHCPGVLVNWNMAHGDAEPSGLGTPPAADGWPRQIRMDAFPGADAVDVMDLDIYGRGEGRHPDEARQTLAEWGGICQAAGVPLQAFSETWAQFESPTRGRAPTAVTDAQALAWFEVVWPHFAALAEAGELAYVQCWLSDRPRREGLKFTYRPEPDDIPLTFAYLADNWYGPDPQGQAQLIEPVDVVGEPPTVDPDPDPEPDPEPPVVIEPEPEPEPDHPTTPGEPIPGVELVTLYPAWDRNPEMRAVGHPNTGEPTIVTILALAPNTDRVGWRLNGGEWVQLTGDLVGQTIVVPSGSSIDVRGRRPGANHQWLNDWTTVQGV